MSMIPKAFLARRIAIYIVAMVAMHAIGIVVLSKLKNVGKPVDENIQTLEVGK